MDKQTNLFSDRVRNKSVDLIERAGNPNVYALLWSDKKGYAKMLQLPWDEVQILKQLVEVAIIHHEQGIVPNKHIPDITDLDVL